jgi:hypothetical protein
MDATANLFVALAFVITPATAQKPEALSLGRRSLCQQQRVVSITSASISSARGYLLQQLKTTQLRSSTTKRGGALTPSPI